LADFTGGRIRQPAEEVSALAEDLDPYFSPRGVQDREGIITNLPVCRPAEKAQSASGGENGLKIPAPHY
jgi:hypothetical protein